MTSARGRSVAPAAEWLLARVLPSGMRDQLLADLAELAPSRSRPRVWYWGQLLRTLWPPTLVALYTESTRPDQAWPDTEGGNAMTWLESLVADVRRSGRTLRRRPAFALTAVATLAIGIGATTAMFSVTWGVALRPLPFEHHDRLMGICTRADVISPDACVLSPPNAEDLKRRVPGIAYLGIGRRWDAKLRLGDQAEIVSTAVLTPDVFRALGVRAQRGRLIEEKDLIGRHGVVAVISDDFWRTRLGAQDVIGEPLTLDGEPVTIVGVLPPGLEIPWIQRVAVWRPLHLNPTDEENRGWAGFHPFALARDGYSPQRLAREVASAAQALRAEHFATTAGWDLHVRTLSDLVVGRSRHLLLVFLGSVALLLLVACANVANLMLEQAIARRREWGIRTALGASPERIVTLQLTESFLLAFAGALGGLGIAVAGVRALKRLAPPGLPRLEQVSVDATVLAFATAVAVLTAVLFGLWPAMRAAAVQLSELLRSGGRTSTAARTRLSSTLVVAQIAIAMTLVAGAGLLARSFQRMAAWNPGFDPARLVTFSVSASRDKYPDRARIVGLWSAIEEQVGAIPGVQAVSSASAGPMFGGGDGAQDFTVEGQDRARPAYWFNVGPSYFHTLGVPVVQGREFDVRDAAGRTPVAIVNESFARQYVPTGDAVGTRVLSDGQPPLTIVGVARDVPPFTPGAPVQPQLWYALRQETRGFVYIVARYGGDPATLAPAVRQALRRVDPDLQPGNYRTIADIAREELRRPLFNALLLAAFALTALALAGIGTYALLAYHVRRRVREMGIRLALGAKPADVAALVLRDGLAVGLPGLVLGVVGGLVAGRLLTSLAPGVSPTDPGSLAAAALGILAVALLACLAPARRAAALPPAITLQAEDT